MAEAQKSEDPKSVVVRFNDAINARDLDRLVSLMTDDHLFVDPANAETRGRDAMKVAWQKFFAAFPDYRNQFESVEQRDSVVVVAGRSACSVEALAGPALWRAVVRDGRVSEWRVYVDDEATRRELGIAGKVTA